MNKKSAYRLHLAILGRKFDQLCGDQLLEAICSVLCFSVSPPLLSVCMGLRERGNGVRTVIVAIVDGIKSLDVGPRAGFHVDGPKVFLPRGTALAAGFEPPHRLARKKLRESDSGSARTFSGFEAKPRAGNPRPTGGLLAHAAQRQAPPRACDAETAQTRGSAARFVWNAARWWGAKAARPRAPLVMARRLDMRVSTPCLRGNS